MRAITTLFPILLILVLIAACGDDDDTPVPATATSIPATATAPALTTPTPVAIQELRANLGGEPSTLDPQLATGLHEFSVIRQVFQGLLGFNADLSLKPVVALEVPTVENGGISDDGLVYTFKLREDAIWSDGQSVTADDFVFAIKRLLDPQLGAPNSFLYFGIAGAMEYTTSGEVDDAALEALRDAVGVEAMDNTTLKVTLSEPGPTFLQLMALTYVYPVRQDIIETAGAQWTEAGTYIGNGPYIMTEWAHQDHITLELYSDYWGPMPNLTKITYRMITDPNSELAAYRNDELDLSQVPPGIEESITGDATLGAEVVRSLQLFTFGVFFNTTAAPFDEVTVRKAFAMAIDRDSWVDKIKNGVGLAATSWLPPGMPGYDPAVGSENAFDPSAAQALLSSAGFPGGDGFPDVSYAFVDAGEGSLIAEFLQGQFRDNLGIEVSLEPLDPPSYFQKVIGGRDFQLTGIGWGADYPDPESFLAPLFMTGSPQNIAGYSNPEFDGSAGPAFAELDQAMRIDLWQRAHEVLMGDVPVAPFFHNERFFLLKPQIQGLTLTPIDGAIPGDTMLGEVSISP